MDTTKMLSKETDRQHTYIPITDDFMFCTVMEDKKKCKEFLQRVLKIKIVKIKTVRRQMDIKTGKDAKGIRLDVYVIDSDGNAYDIEMQTYRADNIGKRVRYYHSEMDNYQIKKGASYSDLKKNIVIFICTFDYFGLNRSIYTFKSTCQEDFSISLEDEQVSIFLNTQGNRDDVDADLGYVLDYMKTGKALDAYTKSLEQSVRLMNDDDDWRNRHMTLQMKMDEQREMGIAIGKEMGVAIGKEMGVTIGKEMGVAIGETQGVQKMIQNLMTSQNLSFEEACDTLLISDRDKYRNN